MFAVAFQFPPGFVLLTIAENHGVPDETKTQLGEIWNFLQIFSARMDGSNKSTNSEYDSSVVESPPTTEPESWSESEGDDCGSIEQDISDFYQLIFKYSFDKFLKRFEKRWMAFKRLFGDKNSFVYKDSVLTPEDAESLHSVFNVLQTVYEKIDNYSREKKEGEIVTEVDWKHTGLVVEEARIQFEDLGDGVEGILRRSTEPGRM